MSDQTTDDRASLDEAALAYHAHPSPGKIKVELCVPAETQRHLALAYSPGVAAPVRAIHSDPEGAYRYTIKGNLVAVISNGTAILGLGNLGALASKPVMEGKCLLFKRFADIDAIDIEVDTEDPAEFVDTVARIACSFGGINLEDIKSPECFEIERELIERCDIPVFHDDQHGTAIVTLAGTLNALHLQRKRIDDVRIVCLGAGASGIVCMDLMIKAGAQRENVLMLDSQGVIHTGRERISDIKRPFAADTEHRSLENALRGCDVFVGLSGTPNALTPDMLRTMAERPVVLACSNPDPEIDPDLARSVRDDVIVATGRSDYPNQVNNVLGFPFIFRGALDVRARTINDEMKMAAVRALVDLAREPVPAAVLAHCDEDALSFGPDYIIPKPMDPRLLPKVAAAVARAAVDSGVAEIGYPDHYPPHGAG